MHSISVPTYFRKDRYPVLNGKNFSEHSGTLDLWAGLLCGNAVLRADTDIGFCFWFDTDAFSLIRWLRSVSLLPTYLPEGECVCVFGRPDPASDCVVQ